MLSNYLLAIFKGYSNMKKIYFFIILAVILLIFNLTKVDSNQFFSNDSKIGLIGVVACTCAVTLLLILYVSKKINSKH